MNNDLRLIERCKYTLRHSLSDIGKYDYPEDSAQELVEASK